MKRAEVKKVRKVKRLNGGRIAFWGVFFVVCLMLVKAATQQPQILANKQRAAELDEQIAYEKLREKEIDTLKERVNTDEYIEKVARDKLGLIKENEKVFIDVAN